jgi:predicted small lipoprotein YifL
MSTFYPGPILAGLLLAVLLAGCGQKGALYLPAPPAPPASSEPSQPLKP